MKAQYSYPEGTICELPPPLRYPPRKMKKKEPKVYDTQVFQGKLHQALEEGDVKKAINALCECLSHHGEFTDYYTRFPQDWKRMEELRGR